MTAEVLLHDAQERQWLSFKHPLETVAARHPDEVMAALQRIGTLVEEEGLHAAGYLTYEAAAAFDPACSVHPPAALPLLWFGIYQAPQKVPPPAASPPVPPPAWQAGWTLDQFSRATAEIHAAIAAGETYQVNLTFPISAPFDGDPRSFFGNLVQGQGASYAAYLDLGRHVICSASPELFFMRNGRRLVMRPMKGTIARGRTPGEDAQCVDRLRSSAKERAENIMILDMVRNDLARLAGTGKVRTTALCALEKYPTLWQMTSTAETETTADFAGVMEKLFPCASITGAPKYSTMAIIKRLEKDPRNIYTGCIGYLAPHGRAQFSVAIRTVQIDRQQGRADYGVGAGITWDSSPAAEYQECLDKARVLTRTMPAFELLETLLWRPEDGYFLLKEHLDRLTASADYFDYPCDATRIIDYLQQASLSFSGQRQRLRLRLAADGGLQHDIMPMPAENPHPVRLRLARHPIDPSDMFLYHKTTFRSLYQKARVDMAGDCDDVILWNQEEQVTETTIANLVVDLDGALITPPVACGLLPGTFRARLLADAVICERPVSVAELWQSKRIFVINALRGWREARLD